MATKRKRPSRGALGEYAQKRDFGRTPEPAARGSRPRARKAALSFVVQQHAARRLHYDFRLEHDGVLKSWAIPKGPSLDTGSRRMAVQTEDHPLEYAGFEGVIPAGQYGAGAVSVWDRGTWEPIGDARAGIERGDLAFRLFGAKLRGRWHLVRMRPRAGDRRKKVWLLIKGRDAEARRGAAAEIAAREPRSVLTGRDLDGIAHEAERDARARAASRGKRVRRRARADPPAAGSKRAPLPRLAAPQLATLVDAPPEGDDWLHEIKLDGYRILARIEDGHVRLFTRNGKDWTRKLGPIAAALAQIPAAAALIDGEAVVLDESGRSRFQLLQNALRSPGANLAFYAFDLLHLDGLDLRGANQLARKQALHELLARVRHPALRVSDHLLGGGPEFFAEACRNGAEGIVSKRASAAHRPGRSRCWLKVKCGQRQEFVVVGFTDPGGSRAGLGALLLGVHDEQGALRYAGKVGTGFSETTLAELRARLETLERKAPSVADPQRAERRARWAEPVLVAEVAFTEWTSDGKVRHPAFIALRSDKPASSIRREIPERTASVVGKTQKTPRASAAAAPSLRREVAGVRLTHPDRVYFPDLGVTKSEIAQFYEHAAERALPGLVRRPLSLVRCPDGTTNTCFYQKHANRSVPARVGRVVVEEGEAPYAMVTDLPSLISLVQIGVIELHVWGARADRIEKPDLLVLDLDPDPAVSWQRLADAARLLRALLGDLGLVPFVRTTGGKGLHVVVPLQRRSSWPELKSFAHGVALQLVREAPDQFTAQISKAKRAGKILIDYLRNQREATAIASYSLRARSGAPVAMPLAWEELDRAAKMPAWSVRDARDRLSSPDPWSAFEDSRRAITAAAHRRVSASS